MGVEPLEIKERDRFQCSDFEEDLKQHGATHAGNDIGHKGLTPDVNGTESYLQGSPSRGSPSAGQQFAVEVPPGVYPGQ